jgi:hypothetical protein
MRKLLLALLFACAGALCAVPAHAQIIIIASPNMNVDSITKDELHDIFTGASTNFRLGLCAKPVLLKEGAAHNEFLAGYIGIRDVQFRSNWRGLLFAGQRSIPPSFDTEAQMVEFVAHNLFIIGYIHRATPHEGVRVLQVK